MSVPVTPVPPRAGVREWLGLAVLSLAVLLIAIDATVLDVAIPFISEELAPSGVQLLWIIDAYGFVIAALLITMGGLGDRIGRRKLLLIGSAGFGAASMLAAFATEPAVLIAARVLQGVAGATLMPATLASIRAMFSDARQRATAIGIWGAMWGGGAAVGPLLGGWLLEHFWWGSVFLVNVPIMGVLLLAAPFVVPESRDPRPGRFDLASAGLSAVALLAIVYAVKEFAVHGPSVPIVVIAGLGVLIAGRFVRRQRTLADPLIDLQLFRLPVFTTSILVNLMALFAVAGVLFFGSQYLQLVLQRSPLQAGLLILPGSVAMVVGSLLAAPLATRWGPRATLVVPLLVAAGGAALLTTVAVAGSPARCAVGFAVLGLGAGIALTLTSALVVESVPAERAGAASAISETGYELGNALGVAVLGSVTTAIFRAGVDTAGLPDGLARTAHETLGGAVAVAGEIGGSRGTALLESARGAFVAGTHVAAAATTALLLVTAVLVLVRLRPGSRPSSADGGGVHPIGNRVVEDHIGVEESRTLQ